METRNIKIDIQTAKDWYYGEDKTLKKLALQAFSIEELQDFRAIKTLENACDALQLKYIAVKIHARYIYAYSIASAAMFKLNIIRKALNLEQDLHLTKNLKDFHLYYPYNPFVTKSSVYYEQKINSGEMEIIGEIKSEGKDYYVLGGNTITGGLGGTTGLGYFDHGNGVSNAYAALGFLGCASKEIAQHFGKYFGMLITEAKYGDMVDFEIIDCKYSN